MKPSVRRQAGVSLIEALVAMAVMAFGMLALLGLQAALRGNSDVSKQRAEAVRFAQELIETKRRYSVLEASATGLNTRAWTDISTSTPSQVALSDYASSTTFYRGFSVTELPSPAGTTDIELYYQAPHKLTQVAVTWQDRNAEGQRVDLGAIVSKTSPEVVGALSVTGRGSVTQGSNGMHRAVPRGSVRVVNGEGQDLRRSAFTPPGSSGVNWIFDSATGFIVQSCTNLTPSTTVTGVPAVIATGCTAFNRRLLSGYIRYAVSGSTPGSAQSETPPDYDLGATSLLPDPDSGVTSITVGVMVHVGAYSDAANAEPLICYTSASPTAYGAYYCALPVDSDNVWSGRSTITFNHCWSRTTRRYNTDTLSPYYTADLNSPYRCAPQGAELFAANSTLDTANAALVSSADSTATRYRICRYTTRRDQSLVSYPESYASPPPLPWINNYEHPLDYSSVSESLTNQNFLIIRAGSGTVPYNCPEDNSSTPISGRTWFHQPPT